MVMDMSTLSMSNVFDEQSTLGDWNRLLKSFDGIYSLYNSPDWFYSLKTICPDRLRLEYIKSPDKMTIKAIFPVETNNKMAAFFIGKKPLFRYTFKCVSVLGGEPLGSATAEECEELFDSMISSAKNIEGLYFKCVRHDIPFMTELRKLKEISANFIYYNESGREKLQYIKLGESFEEYLNSRLNRKGRNTLGRKHRKLSEFSNGDLILERIVEDDNLGNFIESAKYVINNSWKADTDENRDLFSEDKCKLYKEAIKKGLFRSYILKCKNKPLAFVLGYQYHGIYHYSNLAYDVKYATHSPGTVLLYMLIEDLYLYKKADIVNFGIGDAQYKRRFCTDSFPSSSIIIFRRNLKNRTMVAILNLLNAAKNIIKKIIRYKTK